MHKVFIVKNLCIETFCIKQMSSLEIATAFCNSAILTFNLVIKDPGTESFLGKIDIYLISSETTNNQEVQLHLNNTTSNALHHAWQQDQRVSSV